MEVAYKFWDGVTFRDSVSVGELITKDLYIYTKSDPIKIERHEDYIKFVDERGEVVLAAFYIHNIDDEGKRHFKITDKLLYDRLFNDAGIRLCKKGGQLPIYVWFDKQNCMYLLNQEVYEKCLRGL